MDNIQKSKHSPTKNSRIKRMENNQNKIPTDLLAAIMAIKNKQNKHFKSTVIAIKDKYSKRYELFMPQYNPKQISLKEQYHYFSFATVVIAGFN